MDAHGCDIDKEVLEVARLRAELEGVHVSLSSCEAGIPYADGTFDVIFCQSVLEHIPQPEPVVKEICRVLKKGGIAYIEAPNYRKCIEPHYKIVFFPKMVKSFAKKYLSLIGRPSEFIDTVSYVDDRSLTTLFKCIEGVSVEHIGDRFAVLWSGIKRPAVVMPVIKERLSFGFRLMRRLVAAVDAFCEGILRIRNVYLLVRK